MSNSEWRWRRLVKSFVATSTPYDCLFLRYFLLPTGFSYSYSAVSLLFTRPLLFFVTSSDPCPGRNWCWWSLSAELQTQVPIWGLQDTLRRELKDCLSLSLVSFPQTLNSKWSTELGEHQVSDTVGVAFNGVAETGLLSPLDPASPWTDYGKGNKGIWRGKIED